MKFIEPHVYHIRAEYLLLPIGGKWTAIKSMCGRYMYEEDIPSDDGPCNTCERIFERDYEMCIGSEESSHKISERDSCECQEEDEN